MRIAAQLLYQGSSVMKLSLAKKGMLELGFFNFSLIYWFSWWIFKHFCSQICAWDELQLLTVTLTCDEEVASTPVYRQCWSFNKGKAYYNFHIILTTTIYQLLWTELLWKLQYNKKMNYIKNYMFKVCILSIIQETRHIALFSKQP